jgi:uncharacterized protein (DUF1330 family)
MPAYFVGEVDVRDHEEYAVYATAAAPLIDKFGGKVLAKGGPTVSHEGPPPAGRIVIIEFTDAAAAAALRNSPEYQAIAAIRRRSATARVYVVEGV